MISMSRLERSLFTLFERADKGYASFLAMVLMIRVLDLSAALDSELQPGEVDCSDDSHASQDNPGALPPIAESDHSMHEARQAEADSSLGNKLHQTAQGTGYRPMGGMGVPHIGSAGYQPPGVGGPHEWGGGGHVPPAPSQNGQHSSPPPKANTPVGGAYVPSAPSGGYQPPRYGRPQRQSGGGGAFHVPQAFSPPYPDL